MRGEVISLHDGFHLDVAEVEPIPPKAIVEFESGMALVVDERMRWESLGSRHSCWCAGLSPIVGGAAISIPRYIVLASENLVH